MSANQQYLYNNMPQMAFKYGARTTTGLKIISGIAAIPATSKTQYAAVNVNYQGEFMANSKVMVTTGIVISNMNERHGTVTLKSRSGGQIDETGFTAYYFNNHTIKANQKIKGWVDITYMAMGVTKAGS